MFDNLMKTCHTTERDRRNGRLLALWTLAWMASWVGVSQAIRREMLPTGLPAVAATIGAALLGLVVVFVYYRLLTQADELRRKIELDALAAALGVGVVGGLTYWQLHLAGGIEQADVLNLVVAMIFTHALAAIIGHRRYA